MDPSGPFDAIQQAVTRQGPFGGKYEPPLNPDQGVPLMDALVTLAGALTGTDARASGRSLADLGIAGLDRGALERYLATGSAG